MGKWKAVIAALTVTALTCLPLRPAHAGGPLLAAPWAIGQVVSAVTALAVVASAVTSAVAPPPAYAAAAPYYPSPDPYYAPQTYDPYGYHARPPTVFVPPPAQYYPAGGYRGWAAYRPTPSFQQAARGYYPPGLRYAGGHGTRGFGPPRGFSHRHW